MADFERESMLSLEGLDECLLSSAGLSGHDACALPCQGTNEGLSSVRTLRRKISLPEAMHTSQLKAVKLCCLMPRMRHKGVCMPCKTVSETCDWLKQALG